MPPRGASGFAQERRNTADPPSRAWDGKVVSTGALAWTSQTLSRGGQDRGRPSPFIQFNLIQPAQPYKKKEDRLVRGIKSWGGGRNPCFTGVLRRPSVCQTSAKYGALSVNPEDRGARDRLGFCAFLELGRTLFPWCRACSRAVLQGFGCEGGGGGGMIPFWGRRFLGEVLWAWLTDLVG